MAKAEEENGSCSVSCHGLYADIFYMEEKDDFLRKDIDKLREIQNEYNTYKNKFAENLFFRSNMPNYSKWQIILN